MARFRFDARRSAGTALIALCLAAAAAVPAELTGTLDIKGAQFRFGINDDTIIVEDAEITHGRDMFITARLANHVQRPGRVNELTLSGGVHITYRGAVLDADSALIVFRDQKLQSARVQGSQATFSHQPTGSSRRRQGRADVIEFDGSSDRVKLSGSTWYENGPVTCNIEQLLYDLSDGQAHTATGKDKCTVDLDSSGHVPTPRTPERSTAQ